MPGLDPIVPISYVFNGSTTDSYQYLSCPGTGTVTIQISNANVSINFGRGSIEPGSGVFNLEDEIFIPVVGGLDRECDVIRFKSAVPGTPAVIQLSCRPK